MLTSVNLFYGSSHESCLYCHNVGCSEGYSEGCSESGDGEGGDDEGCEVVGASSLYKHPYPNASFAFGSHEEVHCAHTFQRADDQITLHHKG